MHWLVHEVWYLSNQQTVKALKRLHILTRQSICFLLSQNIEVEEGLSLRVPTKKLIILYLNQNMCCGYLKEPCQSDGSFEHPNHVLKLMGKKIL